MYSQGGNHYKNDGNQATQLTVVGSDGFPKFFCPCSLERLSVRSTSEPNLKL